MAMILYEDGKEVGEVSEWELVERMPEKKMVLGKEIITGKPKDLCHFVSPKPVSWKKRLWLIADDGMKIHLSEVNVRGATTVTATIVERVKP
jgi:hypothetical protein